jgi:iron complex outermembrane receptor protein
MGQHLQNKLIGKTSRAICTVLIIMLFLPTVAMAQNCNITLKGRILDEHDDQALGYAQITLEESGKVTAADKLGNFTIQNLCPGHVDLVITHLNCDAKRIGLNISSDTSIVIYLEHHDIVYNPTVFKRKKKTKLTSQTSTTLNTRALEKNAGKSLGGLLEDVSGVSTVRSGPNVQKPVIHGLFGNRILLVNHGVGLMGQQWGQDHAPEIDPFTAGKITVLKGAASVKYGVNASGGVVLIDPAPLPTDHHLHGNVFLNMESNGRGGASSIMLNSAIKSIPGLAWRVQASGKYFGDFHAADYNLSNTGLRENNLSFTTGYKTKKHKTTLYISHFDVEAGVLRGSHIGNLTDLKDALQRDEPLFTSDFSYDINSPRQETSHTLLKGYHSRKISKQLQFNLTYARQENRRKEFDIRRDKKNLPALDVTLKSNYLRSELEHKKLFKHLHGELGIEYSFQENSNSTEIGIEPFVPNFTRSDIGIYLIERWIAHSWIAEAGIRYSDQDVSSKIRDGSFIKDYNFTQDGLSANIGLQVSPLKNWGYRINYGSNIRPPALNERFSNGLHHGAARIEEGNLNLKAEKSGKLVQSISYNKQDKIYVDVAAYFHSFDDFIYLAPDSVPRLTIRGAFPVFRYKQVDATIWGLDFYAKINLWKRLSWVSSFSTVVGEDVNDNYLNNMPADRFENSLVYSLDSFKSWNELEIEIGSRKVWQLNRANEVTDLLAPPKGYFLSHFEISARRSIREKELVLSLGVQNIFNTSYREYLNGSRYFSDELGRNIQLKSKWIF